MLNLFFHAEDGIRDIGVTGVQRVLFRSLVDVQWVLGHAPTRSPRHTWASGSAACSKGVHGRAPTARRPAAFADRGPSEARSEERRVGKQRRIKLAPTRKNKKIHNDHYSR